MARSRTRQRWLVAVVVLFLLGVSGAVFYVWQRGRQRTDPYRQAYAAHEAGDLAAAEGQLRDLLATDPSHLQARSLLIRILSRDGRGAEAEDLARHLLDAPETRTLGLRTLSELAFRRADTAAALRYARMASEGDPAFSLEMQSHVRDVLGTPADREASVRAAETVGMLAKTAEARAGAFLYAAETLHDLARLLPEGALRTSLAERQELDRRLAQEAAGRALQAQAGAAMSPVGLGMNPEIRALASRLRLLSTDPEERRQGVAELETLLGVHGAAHQARAALIRHLAAQGRGDEAVAHARQLKDAPLLLVVRSVLALAQAGQRAAALEVLEAQGERPGDLRVFLRARLLVLGEGAEREKGLSAYEALAATHAANAEIVQEAYRQVEKHGGRERALRLLEAASAKAPGLGALALLERTAAAIEASGVGASKGHMTELAANAAEADLLAIHARLLQIKEGGEGAAFAFLEEVLHAGKVEPSAVRVLRAAIATAKAGATSTSGTAPDGRPWSQVTRDDLDAIALDAKASTAALLRASALATVQGERRLQGLLLARALAQPAPHGGAHAIYLRAAADADDAGREVLARGMREAIERAPEARRWIEILADAVASGDAQRLRRKSSVPAAQDVAPAAGEAELQLLLALQARDWPEVEAFARHILATWPERPHGRERLGSALLATRKHDEVLALHPASSPELVPRLQRIEALIGLQRKADALTEARALVNETNGEDPALHALARMLREIDPDAALAALSSVQGSATVELLRAELLEQRGEKDVAVQVYERMLKASDQRNLGSWRGLARVLSALDRDTDFILRVSRVLEAPPRGLLATEAAQLFLLRGQAHEKRGAFEQALADYRRALEISPKDPVALNNAAWLLGSRLIPLDSRRGEPRAEALTLVDRALEVAPHTPQVHHTRAKILAALERRPEALEALDRALALTTDARAAAQKDGARAEVLEALKTRLATYLFDKAQLLEESGDPDAAAALFARVRDEHPGTHLSVKAAAALTRLGK